jgi:manganese-dependent inorganic pyrophosphatase
VGAITGVLEGRQLVGEPDREIAGRVWVLAIGSIETRNPVQATVDPVGSTATPVIERFRQNGMEPSRATAMLLGAVLSGTVILNSPTTTERDHAMLAYLEQVLTLDAREFGHEMFEHTNDLTHVAARQALTSGSRPSPGQGARTRSRRASARARIS